MAASGVRRSRGAGTEADDGDDAAVGLGAVEDADFLASSGSDDASLARGLASGLARGLTSGRAASPSARACPVVATCTREGTIPTEKYGTDAGSMSSSLPWRSVAVLARST